MYAYEWSPPPQLFSGMNIGTLFHPSLGGFGTAVGNYEGYPLVSLEILKESSG
jgi:hypothetical protein